MKAEAETFLPDTQEFLDSVLRIRPSVAAFDCDGTLWSGDAGAQFFEWELQQDQLIAPSLVPALRKRYAAYKRGEVDETTMCGEMVSMHRGLSERKMMDAAVRFFDEFFVQQIFPDMRELVRRLQGSGCEIWAVSSTNDWVISAAMQHFGIPANHVLAASVQVENDLISDRLIRVPSGSGKPEALRTVGKGIDAAFGNSRWDTEMLAMAKYAYAVNANPDLEAVARRSGWPVYFPEATRSLS